MRQYLLKYLLLISLFCFAKVQPLFSQTGKNSYQSWSEPLFDDNVADFKANPGSYEFSLNIGATPKGTGWMPNVGWEAEVVATRRLGFEMGFYSSLSNPNKETLQAEATQVAFCFQYNLTESKRNAWATGAEFYSPGWSRFNANENAGWSFRPFIIYGERQRGGFNSQWKLSPNIEFEEDGLQSTLFFQNASFLEKDGFSIGMELGSAFNDHEQLLFAAPQAGVYLGNYSLFAGWWQPFYFNETDADWFLLFSLSYTWEKKGSYLTAAF